MSETSDAYVLLSRLREMERELGRLRREWKTFRDGPTAASLADVARRVERLSTSLGRLAASADSLPSDRSPEARGRSGTDPAPDGLHPDPRSVVAASRQIDSTLQEVARRWQALATSDLEKELARVQSLLLLGADRCSTLIMALGGVVERSADRARRSVHTANPAGRKHVDDLIAEIEGRLWDLRSAWHRMRQRPTAGRLRILMDSFEDAAATVAELRSVQGLSGAAETRRALRIQRHIPGGVPFLPYRDPVTGAYNREGFDTLAGAELNRCRRYGRPFGVLVMRLSPPDLAGLRSATETIRSELREYDLVARHADDRIVVGLPESAAGATRRVASRLIRALRENRMHGWFQQLAYATVPEDGATLGGLLDAAFDRLRS